MKKIKKFLFIIRRANTAKPCVWTVKRQQRKKKTKKRSELWVAIYTCTLSINTTNL